MWHVTLCVKKKKKKKSARGGYDYKASPWEIIGFGNFHAVFVLFTLPCQLGLGLWMIRSWINLPRDVSQQKKNKIIFHATFDASISILISKLSIFGNIGVSSYMLLLVFNFKYIIKIIFFTSNNLLCKIYCKSIFFNLKD